MKKLLTIILLGLSCVLAARIEKPDAKPEKTEEEEFDGVGIALVERPTECERPTRKGDLIKVTFNATIGDTTGAFSKRYMTEPLEFVIGDGEMIAGFDAGVVDMCPGELRHISVPAKYAYEGNGMGGELPSRATLYFFVRLVSTESIAKHKARKPNAFSNIDEDGDKLISRDEVHSYLKKNGVKDVVGDHGLKQITRDIFREEDRNSNGYIEHVEFSGAKKDEL